MHSPDKITDQSPPKLHPPIWIILMLAAQHVVILFSGIILVPVMLANIFNFSSSDAHYMVFITSLCAAASTLLQLIRGKKIGLGSPMFMGTSGAFLPCSLSALALGGPALLAGMVILTAPFQFIFSYLIRFMRHILTPTVGGVIIMLAVVGLLKNSIATWTDTSNFNNWPVAVDIAIGTTTIFVMVGIEWFGGKKLRPWGLAFGIFVGCAIPLLAGLPIIQDLSNAPWIGMPQGKWPGISIPMDHTEHWTLAFTFLLAVLATSIKYTGDAMALQRIAEPDRRNINYDALQGGLYANTIGMLLAGFTGGMPSSSHSSNIPLMDITGNTTRRVAAVAALLLAVISFSPKTMLLFVNLPHAVIGGVGVVLVAHLFSAGMQLVTTDMNNRNGLIAGLSLCAGLIASSDNFFPDAFPNYLDPLVKNGMAIGGLVAILLTIITLFGAERRLRITVNSNMENFTELMNLLTLKIYKMKLNDKNGKYLELACEEVFIYMCDECRAIKYDGPISFSIGQNENSLLVEAAGGVRFATEADAIAAREILCPETLGGEKLNALGLAILGRIAKKVSHVTISGYTYISFELPIER